MFKVRIYFLPDKRRKENFKMANAISSKYLGQHCNFTKLKDVHVIYEKQRFSNNTGGEEQGFNDFS